MKKNASVSLELEIWDALQVEADKREISRNELIGRICSDLVSGSPIISEIVDLDKELKKKQVDIATERHRKLKNDNDFFTKHGYYPTKPVSFVTRVVEQPIKKEWIGENYKQQVQQKAPKKKQHTNLKLL